VNPPLVAGKAWQEKQSIAVIVFVFASRNVATHFFT